MKRTKIVLSMLLALVLVCQLLVAGLPTAYAESSGESYEVVPQLSDGLTLEDGADLTVTGTVNGSFFTFANDASLSFQVSVGEGWTYCDEYSLFFENDAANSTVSQANGIVSFTYEAEPGDTVSLEMLNNIQLNATPDQLPVLKITIDGSFSSVNKEDWTEAEFELIAGTKVFSSGNSYTGSGEIKGRGNSSWGKPQKPYSLKLSQKTSLLGIPATKKYAIVASYSDDSLMRNYVTYKSALAMEGFQYVPKCEFVEVYLNGTYNGVYILVERIDIESTKIDIDEATPDNLTGGYIIEKDAGDKVDKSVDPWFPAPFQANPNEDLFTLKAPDVEDGMLEYLEEYMEDVHDAIMGTSDAAYTDYVDISSWADFLVLQEIAKNVDGNLKTSCYFVKERDNNVLRMDAPWDFDLSYGVANWSNASYNNDYWDCPTGTGTSDFMVINSSCPWFQTLYTYEDFKQLVHERYTQYRQTMIPTMQSLIYEQAAYLSDAAASHNQKWFYYDSFDYGVEDFYTWLDGRLDWLDDQWLIEEPEEPVTPPAGTEIGLIDDNTDIVYTPNQQFAGEGIGNAFDKNYSTKWCAAYTPNYVVFDIQEPAVPTRLKVTHAGGATNPEDDLYNTNDFSLQILDPSEITEAEFLAMSDTEQKAVMGDNNYWIKLLDYVGNEEDVTDDPIVTSHTARIYRLHVTDADDNRWGGPDTVRIYEIELFGIRGGTEEHEHAFGEWTQTTAPTCTEKGEETRTCECGETETREVDALGHSYEAVVTAPTCTEAGYTTYTCSVCGDSYVDDEIAALGHDYEAVVTAPTCTEDGYTTYTCSVCGHSYVGNETAALGHNYEAVVTAPTCTEGGYTTHTCSVCGNSYISDLTDVLGHNYTSVVVAPTCTETGYTEYTCETCGHSYQSNFVYPQGHVIEYVVVEEPTATENGILDIICSVCGEKFVTTSIYAVLEGNEAEWIIESEEELSFLINSGDDELIYVIIDDALVDESAYTVGEDGTITLNPEFLATLEAGEHMMGVIYSEGLAIAAFTVADATEPDVTDPEVTDPEVTEPEVTEPEVTEPKPTKPAGPNDSADTADTAPIVLMTILLMVSAMAMVILVPKFRVKN